MTHEETVAKCLELDGFAPFVYYLTTCKHTYRLQWTVTQWEALSEGGRYSMVKNGNYFLTVTDAEDAIARALAK